MAVFPAIEPDHPATKEVKVRENRMPLGDGREQVVRFGLNPVDTTWRLPWTRLDIDERGEIEDFLTDRAADGEPFEWTPPDADAAQRFRVDQWEPARTTPTGWSLELVFRRVFEVLNPVLVGDTGEPAGCRVWTPPTWDESLSGLIVEEDGTLAAPDSESGATALSAFGLSSGKWYTEVLVSRDVDFSEMWVGFAQSASAVPGAAGSGGFGVAGSTGVFNDLAGGFTASEDEPSEVEEGGNYYRADDANSELRLALAIDFDAKRAWLGAFDEALLEWNYDGNPAAGTGAMRSGWTGTPTLRIAVGLESDFALVRFNASAIALPPDGFCYWPAIDPTP